MDAFWNDRESKIRSVADSGYRIEVEPERLTLKDREYVRYVISSKNADSEFNRIYMEVLLTPAGHNRRFLVCIKYDGMDMETLDPNARAAIYDDSLEEAARIMDASVPTDETDHETGSLWMPSLYHEPEKVFVTQDSLEYSNGELEVSYHLPEGCYILPDALIGKNYRTEENIYLNVTVWENTTITAEEKAAMHSGAGISKIHTRGKKEVGTRIFHYYTYSVLRRSRAAKSYTYHFAAFCDLGNGNLLEIDGWSYENEAAMDSDFYLDVMDLSENPVQ